MKDERIGYGNLTNLPAFEQVYMITIQEGQGTDESPQRSVLWFYTKDCKFIGRIDPFKEKV